MKNIFCSLLTFEYIVLIGCIVISVTDIVTDIIVSIKYYNGFDHNCLKVNSNLTVHSNLTVDKSSIDRPAHPGWFYLTLFFIVLPCIVRILSIDIKDLPQSYFSCFNKRNRTIRNEMRRNKSFHQNKFINFFLKFLFKLLILPFLPVLVILSQFRQFPLLLKIHQEKKRLDGTETTEEQSICFKIQRFFKNLKNLCSKFFKSPKKLCSQFFKKLKNLCSKFFKSLKKLCGDKNNESIKHDD